MVFVKERYATRNVVERCILRLNQWHRVATRYDKRADNYLAFDLGGDNPLVTMRFVR